MKTAKDRFYPDDAKQAGAQNGQSRGLGVSILPELILKRVPYRIVAKELDVPAYRTIAFCLRDKKTASLVVKRFVEYLGEREKTKE